MKRFLTIGCLLVCPVLHSASLVWSRPVKPAVAGPNRLDIDETLLAHAGPVRYQDDQFASEDRERNRQYVSGPDDLRFFTADGREVPFLLVHPSEVAPKWADAKLLPIASTKTASGFEADLGTLRRVDRIRLEGLPAPHLKRYRLEGSGDRTRWTVLVGEGTLFNLPDDDLRLDEAAFNAAELRYLRITWDDRSSGRMPLPRHAVARLANSAEPARDLPLNVTVTRRQSEPGKSRYRIRLPAANLPVEAIELVVPSGHVLRQATIYEGRLSDHRVVPVALGSSLLRRAERGGSVASDLRIPIVRPTGAELELVIEDSDNPSLEISSAIAEVSPLPWIYFESGGEVLTARFGELRLQAPHYDLEAMRTSAALRRDLPRAAWIEQAAASTKTEDGSAQVEAQRGAVIDPKTYRYARSIPESQGLTSLLLDAEVLAHSRIDDLRIVDKSNRQIPYLLEERAEPLELPLTSGEGKAQEHFSRYEVQLPFENLPPSRIVIETSSRVFERNLRLERVTSQDQRDPAQIMASVMWANTNPDAAAPSLVIDLPSAIGRKIAIIVDEGDNAPLPLTKTTLLLPARRVRFFHPGEPLRLLYGNASVAAPRYDLSLLAPRLFGMAAKEISFAAATPIAVAEVPPSPQKLLFWAVLAGAVLILLGLMVRLMRNESTETAAGDRAEEQ